MSCLCLSPSTAVGGAVSSVTAQELYQLRTYLQEAQHREQQIETKLAALQRLVSSTQVPHDFIHTPIMQSTPPKKH